MSKENGLQEITKERKQEVSKPCVLIVGAGEVGCKLVQVFHDSWKVLLVDLETPDLSSLPEEADVTFIQGDATSGMILERADIQDADYVAIATSNDNANLEVAKLAIERFGKSQVVAVSTKQEMHDRLRALGVHSINRSQAVAAMMESFMLKGKRTAMNIGLGQGEIVEVTVSPNSPVVGRPLYTLNPKKWLVGAVYRDNEIIIPHGSTVLKKNDRVLVIGELDMVPAVISFLGSGTPQFPLQFGSLIAIPFLDSKDEGFFQEAILLARQTKAGGIFILNWGRQERLQDSLLELCEGQCVPTQVAGMQGKFCEATLAEIRRRDVGCIVLPRSKRSFWPGRTPRTKDVMRIVNESFQPCLFPAGTFPYKKILVAITESESSLRGVELAIDIARLLGAKLTAVNVIPPRFIAGEESAEQQKQALSKALEIASMHHVKIESMTLEGNPVVELKKAQAGFDLMILTHRPGRGRSLLTPDVSEHLITKSNISILVLPFFDRENGS